MRAARAPAARQAVGWAQPHKRRVQMRGEHAHVHALIAQNDHMPTTAVRVHVVSSSGGDAVPTRVHR